MPKWFYNPFQIEMQEQLLMSSFTVVRGYLVLPRCLFVLIFVIDNTVEKVI